MWKAASLLVCIYILGVCRGFSYPDFLNVDLLEEVNWTSTDGSGRIQHGRIYWLDRPPYIYDENGPIIEKNSEKLPKKKTANSSEESQAKEENVKGILYEIINKGIQICRTTFSIRTYCMKKVQNLQQLDQSIVNKEADFAMPVYGSGDGTYGEYSYVEILKSPGVVFIVNKEETKERLRKQVVQAMKNTWPMIVITLLLTGFAGLVIWRLVSTRLCRKNI